MPGSQQRTWHNHCTEVDRTDMTARVVGIIVLLLLASLLCSWLLLRHYQEQVMEEVARTVSAVGAATLRTMEQPHAPQSAAEPRDLVVVDAADGRTEIELDGATIIADSAAAADGPGTLVISPSRVHTQMEPDRGLVLRIPTFESGHGGASVPDVKAGDFVLPVPTYDYTALFVGLRRRSLLVFAGVFLVGAVLAGAAAARVTRPIRDLDRGLRRVSDGDLSAEVKVRGGGEVERLGTAFNAMIGRLREARERDRDLARREKLASLGRLAAGVAHDVRNPLHSIGLTLAHLRTAGRPREEDADSAREFDRSLSLIRDEVKRLDRLVENFLLFARSERRAPESTDLRELVKETARLVEKDAARRKVAVEVDVRADVARIPLQVEAIRSAILNVVLNAFDAMPDGGTLEMCVHARAGELVLAVRDTGRGIEPAEQSKVFDFGYSGRAGGSGLGLAMVHQVVVEEHGGRVELRSEPGTGTSIELVLPTTAAAAPEVPA